MNTFGNHFGKSMNFFIFVVISLFVFVRSSSISLCDNVTSTWLKLPINPSIVLLREKNSTDPRMVAAMNDVDCWLSTNFNITRSYTLSTRGDAEMMCFKIATVPIKVGQLMVVVTEGSSAEKCSTSLYGPIPNIMNIKMFVDGTKKQSAKRMELSLRNTGGRFGVQFELHRPDVITKIQKTVVFILQLSEKTADYSRLIPFWEPTIEVPSDSYQYRMVAEERKTLTDNHTSISWVLLISVLPMLIFGTVVSCYIVIHPRGGLTYTDEEVDFTIQEVDSNSKVNTAIDKSVEIPLPMILGEPLAVTETHTAKEPDVHTAKESDVHTAIPSDDVRTDKTVLSEKKSTETIRMAILVDRNTEPSLKTGRE